MGIFMLPLMVVTFFVIAGIGYAAESIIDHRRRDEMNKALQEARKKFRGQKAKATTGFDNSPLPEAKYIGEVVKSIITDDAKHQMNIKILGGDHNGRYVFPFKPDLNEEDGVTQFVTNIRAIKGDIVPGEKSADGTLEFDFFQVLGMSEELAHECLGEVVEITVKNSKTLRNDGTPWQNVYINRGLGDDAAAEARKSAKSGDTNERDAGGSMAVGEKKPAARKKAVRKKAVRKAVKKK